MGQRSELVKGLNTWKENQIFWHEYTIENTHIELWCCTSEIYIMILIYITLISFKNKFKKLKKKPCCVLLCQALLIDYH